MAQSQAAAAANDEQTNSFTNKPVVLADNGHGTKVKLWRNDGPGQPGITNVAIERSFKRRDREELETQKVTLNPRTFSLLRVRLRKAMTPSWRRAWRLKARHADLNCGTVNMQPPRARREGASTYLDMVKYTRRDAFRLLTVGQAD